MILLIGATGTVGSKAVRQLLAKGERPGVFTRDPDWARYRFGDQVEPRGDLDQPEMIENALIGMDCLFLLGSLLHT